MRLGRSAGSGSARRRPPPEGWELIEPTLEELEGKMREAETESHEGKRKVRTLSMFYEGQPNKRLVFFP